jgi:arsenate reductase
MSLSRRLAAEALGKAQHEIATRIRLFLSLPFDRLDRLSLQSEVRELGSASALVE